MSLLLAVALGNPGREYEQTRHNLGWFVLDAWARRERVNWKPAGEFSAELARCDRGGSRLWLLKPQTYVNASGTAVGGFARFHKLAPEQVAVIYDDLTIDLPLLKVTCTGSAGGHNGVASIRDQLGDGFARFRLGIGPKSPPQIDLKDFVLGKFSPDQSTLINHNLDAYLRGLDLLLASGPEAAMNQLNRRDHS